MSGLDLLQYVDWALFFAIFVLVLLRTLQRPTPAHVDMTLFFGAITLTIVSGSLAPTLNVPEPDWLAKISAASVMLWPYLLLRLVDDFSDLPRAVLRLSEVGLLVSIGAVTILPTPIPLLPAVWLILYFVAVVGYDTWAFAREAARARGVTQRRMQAVAAGSACLVLLLLLAGLGLGRPDWSEVVTVLTILVGLAAAVCYFVGFAPPAWLRRAWQEPELRAFLSRAAALPRLATMRAIVAELEHGAAASVGAPAASIGLWDANDARLHFFADQATFAAPAEEAEPPTLSPTASVVRQHDTWAIDPTRHRGAGRAFLEQRPTLINDTLRADPDNVWLYAQYQSRSVLAAPITAGPKRLGVLAVYGPRAPVFANSDLELVQLLADQAAVVLESRALVEEAARVQAREEAAMLKDDFLSSAAHDLKTPLTGLVTQAQLLLRRAERNPQAPVDRIGLERLVGQSLRLRDLVLELLDASRLEHGSLLGERERVDLCELVEAMRRREGANWQRVDVVMGAADGPMWVEVDRVRIEQVLTNLVENALKYSPVEQQRRVELRLERAETEAHLAVRDEGIGIPLEDQPLIFERFHRAANVDDRRFAGMGLGLYITRGIVVEHGGRIWVESSLGAGSTFHVALPLVARLAPEPSTLPSSSPSA